MNTLRKVLLLLAAALFLVSGTAHFLLTAAFVRIVPPHILKIPLPPAPVIVYISGAAELAGALGLLIPPMRRAAGWGLALLLVAVFPANVYMAANHIQIGAQALPDWALWGRLVLQQVLIPWVLWCSKL